MYQIMFTIDKDDTPDEQSKQFYAWLKRQGCTWVTAIGDVYKFSTREILIGLFPNKQIFDVTFNAMALRSPKIVGVWDQDGVQQGYKKVVTYNEAEEPVITVERNMIDDGSGNQIAEPLWSPFNLSYYNRYILGEIEVYDEATDTTTTVQIPNGSQVHNWAGWSPRDLSEYD